MHKNKIDLKKLRINYKLNQLIYNDLCNNPVDQFKIWLEDAIKCGIKDANAMILSTYASQYGISSRVVLLKDIVDEKFVFFTNYNSLKGKQIQENNKIALCFFWNDMERQVRIKGVVKKISKKESDLYFNIRPKMSKIAAIISNQSSYIDVNEKLENKILEFNESNIERPDNWGGYSITPSYFEFWQGRENRLHDRFSYEKKKLNWIINRLSP
tara:strand:+ start:298 stop:936 length:639 start_codon:yes stop_codon:yes gene_type:complete